jgi:hypothetical protein
VLEEGNIQHRGFDAQDQPADSDEENRSFRAEDDQKFAKRRW